MESLPTEAVCNICSFLDVNSSVQLSLVSGFYEGCVPEYVKIHRLKFIGCLREINAIEYHIGVADLVNYSQFGAKMTIERCPEKDYSYRLIGEKVRITTVWDYRNYMEDNKYELGYTLTVATIKRPGGITWVNVGETMPYNYASYWKIFKKYNASLDYDTDLYENETVYCNQTSVQSDEDKELNDLLDDSINLTPYILDAHHRLANDSLGGVD